MTALRGERITSFYFLILPNMSTPILLKHSEKSNISDRGFLFPKRAAFEFYPTPPEAVRALLSVESFEGSVWEPACGDGAISKVLEAAGYQVVSTDLIDRGYGAGRQDFLKSDRTFAKNIITNPPYGTHGL